MLQNRLTKIRILGLLLGIGCNGAMATHPLDIGALLLKAEQDAKALVQQEIKQLINDLKFLKMAPEWV
jgi:hypothetical protein